MPSGLASPLANWWDHADAGFSHLIYSRVRGTNFGSRLNRTAQSGEAALHLTWRAAWLDRICAGRACEGKRVLEYGVGAGLLGQLLLETYGASHYAAVDVSTRQLNATRQRMLDRGHAPSRFSTHEAGVEFAALRPDFLVSQAVIQHFPSIPYANVFLANVNRSGAARLMMHIRSPQVGCSSVCGSRGKNLRFGNPRRQPLHRDVQMGVIMTTPFLCSKLPRYKLEWTKNTSAHRSQSVYHSFSISAPAGG